MTNKANRARRREILNMSLEDLTTAYKARPDVHSIHLNKLTVVFADGNHTHLDTLFPDIVVWGDIRVTLFALYLCQLEGLE